MENLLKDKVALVTGCDQGIGLSICRIFAGQGAIVYANILKEASKEGIQRECEGLSGQAIPVCFDITDKPGIMECMRKIKKEQDGRLDILVNNAGVKKDGLVEMIDDGSIRQMLDVNVVGAIHMTQAALKLMKRKPDQGRAIVNVSSIVGLRGNAGQSIYGATKGAVASLTRSWAKELAPQKIRVNAVAPGSINTAMFYADNEKVRESIDSIGMKRLGEVEEVANVVLFLASDLASYVTGDIIGVDGGMFI